MARSVDPIQPVLAPDAVVTDRWAARRAVAATLHRLPERMLVDRAKGEASAVRRAAQRTPAATQRSA